MTILQILSAATVAWMVVADISWRIRIWRYSRRLLRCPAPFTAHPYRGEPLMASLPSPPLPTWWSWHVFRLFTPDKRSPIPAPGTILAWRKTPANHGVPKSIGFLWLLHRETMRVVGPVKAHASSRIFALEVMVGTISVVVLDQDFHEWLEPTPVTFRPSDGLRVYHMPSPSAYLA